MASLCGHASASSPHGTGARRQGAAHRHGRCSSDEHEDGDLAARWECRSPEVDRERLLASFDDKTVRAAFALLPAEATTRTRQPRLFSYCIPWDDGAAPNPFWGVCTLAICKPRIRRAAEPGDWVVATGSMHSPMGDVSGMLVYAMRVRAKLTMASYDQWTEQFLPSKVPDLLSVDPRRWVGDSIYDFSTDPPDLRLGVHGMANRQRDLGGGYVLVSDHFYYFGDHPQPLPKKLLSIVLQAQGHRSHANDPYRDELVSWIESLGYRRNVPLGQPQISPEEAIDLRSAPAERPREPPPLGSDEDAACVPRPQPRCLSPLV